MEMEYEEVIDEIVAFVKSNISRKTLDTPVESIAVGMTFEYEHDKNQFEKEVRERVKPLITDGWYFDFLCPKMEIFGDLNIYGVVGHIMTKANFEIFKSYMPLRFVSLCPMFMTGVLEYNSPSNALVRAIFNDMFELGTGICKDDYSEITTHWIKSNEYDEILEANKRMQDLANKYGLKVYIVDFPKKKYTKYYIYQVMSPELEFIIKRHTTIRLV